MTSHSGDENRPNDHLIVSYLFKVLKDVADDHLLRLIGVDPSVGVHVNNCIFKPNEGEPQCSLQGL